MRRTILFSCLFVAHTVLAQPFKILFDASQAEMAGNADWIVDADVFNIGVNSAHAMVTGAGNEANPQRYPTPAQSGITSSTSQTYWKGALSYWAIDLVRQGYSVETLPYSGLITYGISTNAQDLSNYKAFIVCEPNIRFSNSEKSALLSFVQNGGGLFMIGDHNISDRNNDGWDSPAIWNDLMAGDPFGMSFDLQNFSQTTTNVRNAPTDPILHGSMGNVTGLAFHNGTSITVNPLTNSTAKGLIYKTGASSTGNGSALFAASNYGSGKVCGLGDSSVPDDGSGDINDALFAGYDTDANGSHRKLLVNATKWLLTPGTAALLDPSGTSPIGHLSTLGMDVYPNPTSDHLTVRYASESEEPILITVIDMTGKLVHSLRCPPVLGVMTIPMDVEFLPSGLYLLKVSNGTEERTERFIRR